MYFLAVSDLGHVAASDKNGVPVGDHEKEVVDVLDGDAGLDLIEASLKIVDVVPLASD